MQIKIKIRIKKIGALLSGAFSEFIADNALKLSAALSYYTIFSLPPLLIVIISISGVFFGPEAVRGELFGQINGLVGNEAAMQIQETIKNVKLSTSSTFATVIGVIILIVGASGQDSINLIWGIQAKPKRGLVKFIKNRVVSFSMIGSVGFLLMVGLIVNSLMDLLNQRLAAYFPKDTVYLFYVLNILIVFFIIALLFTVIFKTLPDGKVALRDCIIGASFTAFLFMVGILILIWVYYSAIILYFGAEFTKVYALNHGNKITPNEYSVLILKQQIEIDPAQ